MCRKDRDKNGGSGEVRHPQPRLRMGHWCLRDRRDRLGRGGGLVGSFRQSAVPREAGIRLPITGTIRAH